MFWRAAKMVIPCEPQIRCMRASDTTYVAEEVEAFLSRENKSGSGLCSLRLLFFLQSCTLCVFLSISALAPFSGGSSTNRCDFSGSAVQHGLQFSVCSISMRPSSGQVQLCDAPISLGNALSPWVQPYKCAPDLFALMHSCRRSAGYNVQEYVCIRLKGRRVI